MKSLDIAHALDGEVIPLFDDSSMLPLLNASAPPHRAMLVLPYWVHAKRHRGAGPSGYELLDEDAYHDPDIKRKSGAREHPPGEPTSIRADQPNGAAILYHEYQGGRPLQGRA